MKHTTTEIYLASYILAHIHNIISTISLAAYAKAKYKSVKHEIKKDYKEDKQEIKNNLVENVFATLVLEDK